MLKSKKITSTIASIVLAIVLSCSVLFFSACSCDEGTGSGAGGSGNANPITISQSKIAFGKLASNLSIGIESQTFAETPSTVPAKSSIGLDYSELYTAGSEELINVFINNELDSAIELVLFLNGIINTQSTAFSFNGNQCYFAEDSVNNIAYSLTSSLNQTNKTFAIFMKVEVKDDNTIIETSYYKVILSIGDEDNENWTKLEILTSFNNTMTYECLVKGTGSNLVFNSYAKIVEDISTKKPISIISFDFNNNKAMIKDYNEILAQTLNGEETPENPETPPAEETPEEGTPEEENNGGEEGNPEEPQTPPVKETPTRDLTTEEKNALYAQYFSATTLENLASIVNNALSSAGTPKDLSAILFPPSN